MSDKENYRTELLSVDAFFRLPCVYQIECVDGVECHIVRLFDVQEHAPTLVEAKRKLRAALHAHAKGYVLAHDVPEQLISEGAPTIIKASDHIPDAGKKV